MKEQLNGHMRNLIFNPYMMGFDYRHKVDTDGYRLYVKLICIIRDILDDCCFNMSCKGYIYIQDCVIAIIDQRNLNIRFKNDVYPYVAAKYGVRDASNIEHSIRNAICSAYRNHKKNPGCGSGIMDRFDTRPTNKEFLLCLTQEVCKCLLAESVEFKLF